MLKYIYRWDNAQIRSFGGIMPKYVPLYVSLAGLCPDTFPWWDDVQIYSFYGVMPKCVPLM